MIISSEKRDNSCKLAIHFYLKKTPPIFYLHNENNNACISAKIAFTQPPYIDISDILLRKDGNQKENNFTIFIANKSATIIVFEIFLFPLQFLLSFLLL